MSQSGQKDSVDPAELAILEDAEQYAEKYLVDPFDLQWFGNLKQQARFGYSALADERSNLLDGARVLEVGGGPFLLATLFAAKGYDVTVIEPRGQGFEQLFRIQEAVMSFCRHAGIRFEVIDATIEEFRPSGQTFDLAFSVNVFEHIDDIESGLENTMSVLSPGGTARILCNNCNFPYEPHYGIPIIWNKAMTERLFANTIHSIDEKLRRHGLWESLNFISVSRLRTLARRKGYELSFDRTISSTMFERFRTDPTLRQRHSKVAFLVHAFMSLGLHKALTWLPARLHPYMSVRISRVRI